MGKYFSDTVDNAIEAIYYTYDKERAAACLQSLADASNAGDGDASYILSRCTSGPQYSWKYHPFQENDEVTEQLIRKSILQGSAMGCWAPCGAGCSRRRWRRPCPSLR